MKGLLLDTHALIWFVVGDTEHMSQATVELICDPAHDVFVSAASIWEIATKSRLGKLSGVEDIAKRPFHYISELAMIGLPVSVDHASRAGLFDMAHRDPFDRMLAAQSHIEELGIVSVDEALDAFDVHRFWPQ